MMFKVLKINLLKMASKKGNSHKKETVIVSVGGSLIVPDDNIDISFLQSLKRCLLGYSNNGLRFFIICGGGAVCRKYQKTADKVTKLPQKELDYIGIQATYLNAFLMKSILGSIADKEIVTEYDYLPKFKKGKSVIVGGGWKPGCSTDTDAIIAAEALGAKRVVNLSNIDFVYDKDPNRYKDAKAIESIGWADFRSLIPKQWGPGLSSPFDPVASKKAQKAGIEVAIINGKKLAQFEHYLNKRPFKGTLIKDE